MALTAEQSKDLTDLLSRVELGEGLGTEDHPCSIAAVNLALSGELTDEIPDCMSLVIGKWIIAVQDLMPHGMRNCRQWKDLLPLAAGTGRDRGKEERRFNLLADWMWERVLPRVPTDKWLERRRRGWEKMLNTRFLVPGLPCSRHVGTVAWAQRQLNTPPSFNLSLGIGSHAVTDATMAQAAAYTALCIDADWEEGVWDDSDGLDVIGTLERLIEV